MGRWPEPLQAGRAREANHVKSRNLVRLGLSLAAPPDVLAVVIRVPVARRVARRDGIDFLDVHGVNLFQTAVFRLNHEEEDNDDEGGAAASKYQAVEVVNLVGDESCAANRQQDRFLQTHGGTGTPSRLTKTISG